MERAQPWLGTLVEIRAEGTESVLARAVEEAFAAVAKVHRLMSYHEPDSDLSRLNREAAWAPVGVDPWTYAVIERALWISVISDGAFDCAVAPVLEREGFLPGAHVRPHQGWGNSRSVRLLGEGRIRFLRPALLDLGGIAKGFAVDKAVEALTQAGVEQGVVNAGGDLRVFGSREEAIHVRDPAAPERLILIGMIGAAAVATSSGYFSRRETESGARTPLVDPRSGELRDLRESVSVIAHDCMTADALTKVAALRGTEADAVLAAVGARAVRIGASA